MSATRKYRVKNRLAAFAFDGGGVTVRTALINADKVMESMKESSLADLDRILAEIQNRFGCRVPSRDDDDLEALYRHSSQIIEASFALPSSGVEQAARSLCDIVDACTVSGVKDWAAIDVHIDGLVLLRANGQVLPAAGRAIVLDGLRKVATRRTAIG